MRESQTCPDCRKLLVEDSHIESLITERKEELVIINKDITSQYNIFRFLRRDTDTLDKENAELLREKRELEYLVNTKKMELGDLKREKKAIKSSIRHINSYRQDLEELDSGS
jgi:DNA repair exonuclease SbcCD ATPase subunit